MECTKRQKPIYSNSIKLVCFYPQSQVASAREAFEQFLQHYPYCYGYWRKFADYERKHSGIEEAKKVLERGLSAIPLSVDLWIHYLNFIIQYNKGNWDQSIRNAFEDAIDKCGLEARSGRLWEAFIDWEKSHGNLDYVLGIYDRLLVIPVIPCEVHFEKFQQFVNSNDPEHMLKSSELLELKQGIDDTLQLDHAEVPEEVCIWDVCIIF
jgi:pre-mRNA-processing factor 39